MQTKPPSTIYQFTLLSGTAADSIVLGPVEIKAGIFSYRIVVDIPSSISQGEMVLEVSTNKDSQSANDWFSLGLVDVSFGPQVASLAGNAIPGSLLRIRVVTEPDGSVPVQVNIVESRFIF